jgi:hypothetical protein
MSIFTVIKYPISDSPTKEEIDALPNELMEEWTHHPDFRFSFSHLLNPPIYPPKNIALLRKLIQEYEE